MASRAAHRRHNLARTTGTSSPAGALRAARAVALPALAIVQLAAPAGANLPPAAPVVTEPGSAGQIVNPSDVHMETAPFSDPDVGDAHFCTDWEIWRISPLERVWAGQCVTGFEKVHAHFGDGAFESSLAGSDALDPDTDYRLRVRHRDDSGQAGSDWSPWTERPFRTAPPTQILALEADDILADPPPRWVNSLGEDIILPPSATTPPSLRLEQASGAGLVEWRGGDGLTNQFIDFPLLPAHEPVRIVLSAGDEPTVAVPESEIHLTDHEGDQVTIYLPPMAAAGANDAAFWISAAGATFHAQPDQTEPSFSTPARSAPTPWIARIPGFRIDTVASGFRLPVNIAFVPNPGPGPLDPLYYVTELYGTIKVVTRSGQVSDYVTSLLNFNPTGQFPGSGEQGLTGIAVDPATGHVYAGLLYDNGAGPDGPHFPRVMRFTSTDGGLTAATQLTILDMAGEAQGQSHQISNMTIGPDGALYVHMGDGFDFTTAQNLGSFRGKILRVSLFGGPAPGNPFYNLTDGVTARDYVYAYGVRNPFGGCWRATDAAHYMVENGPSVDRLAKVVPGRNFGWNGFDPSMRNFAAYNWAPATGPVNCAFVQPETFGGSGFPPEMMDVMFITESGPTWASGPQANGKRITMWRFDESGTLVEGPDTLVEYAGSGKATAVGLAAGPDGLYFTDLYRDQGYVTPVDRGANVLRVKFVGAADFEADVETGPAPLTVSFTDLSSVPDATDWLWSFGDGAVSTQRNPVHTYMNDGVYDVRLTVTGADGVSVELKPGFIRVGQFLRLALIGGTATPGAADDAVAQSLRTQGFEVDVFDDEPVNRPSAAAIAADYDLVLVSSTIFSDNVAGQFAALPIPMIDWEHAIMRPQREPLAAAGGVATGQTAINIIDNAHPITAHEPLGTLTVYNAPSNMSVINAPFGPGVRILATRAGAGGATDAAIAVAEAGAPLLDSATAPARRVFLFLEDFSFLDATHEAEHLLGSAACWALDLREPDIVSQSSDAVVPTGQTLHLTVAVAGAGPIRYQWRRDASPIVGAIERELIIEGFSAADAGTYDVLVTGPCGQAAGAPIAVQATCAADLDLNLAADVFDLLAYLDLWFALDAAADLTNPASIDVFDLLAYLDLWFPASAGGCAP